MASVLIVSVVPVLSDLLHDLASLARHDARCVAGWDRNSPAVDDAAAAMLLDASMPERLRDGWICAAADANAVVIYYASTMSDSELREFAAFRNAPCFPLPNGPTRFGEVLHDALERRVVSDRGELARNAGIPGTSAFFAMSQRVALALARSKLIVDASVTLRGESQRLRGERQVPIAVTTSECRTLHETIVRSATTMRHAGASAEHSLLLVRDALSHSGVLATPSAAALHADADRWVLEAFHAA